MRDRSMRVAKCATLPSNTAQRYHEQQAEEHLELAARGRLRCFACGESQPHNQVRCHPKLFVHVCSHCHDVYHQGEFDVADDGREMYCRMCGDGGELTSCDERQAGTRRPCPFSFCLACIERNFGYEHRVHCSHKFKCWICDDGPMEQLRRRIPGYEHNSKSVLTSLIMQQQRRRQQPRPTGSGGGAQQPAASRRRCRAFESGDESCASEGFPDLDGGGGGGYVHSWKNNPPDEQEDGEGSAAGGMSTDSSDSDDNSTCGDGGYSRRRRRGREGKRNTAGGGSAEDGVFQWDRRQLINDLSRGLENVKIQVCNEEDEEKLPFFRYVTGYVMGGDVHQKKDPDDMVCCDCTDGCRDPNLCACLRLRAGKAGSVYLADIGGTGGGGSGGGGGGGGGAAAETSVEEEKSGRRRFYNDDGLLLHLPDAIFECHAGCACNPRRCKNRVVSRGVHLPLQVFRCAESGKGWGLRCVEPIPAGSFVACYLGEVLTDRSVDDRGRQTHDDYVFGLDFAKCAARPGHSGGSSSKSSRRRSIAMTSSSNADQSNWGLRFPLTAPTGAASASSSPSPRRSGSSAASAAADGGAPGRGEGSASPAVSLKSPVRKKTRTSPSSPLAAAARTGAGARAGGGLSKDQEEAFGDFVVSPNREKLLEGFVGATGCMSRERAAYFLRGAGGDLAVAVNHFLDAPDKGPCADDDADDDVGAQSPAPPLPCEEAKQAGGGATAGGGAASSRRTTVSPPSSPAEVLWQEVGDDLGGDEAVTEAGAGMLVPPWRHGSVAIVAEPLTKNVVPSGATSPPSSSATPPPSDELPDAKRIRRGGDLHESLCEVVDLAGHPPTAVSSPGPSRGSGGSGGQWLTRRKDKTPRESSTSSMATAAETAIAARTHAAAVEGPGVDIAAAGAGGGGDEVAVDVDFEGEAWTPSSPRSDVSPEMAVDAKDFGNVARFMNHSCDGNLVKKMVFVEGHDFRIPRVAFFSLEKIQAYEELTYDYNYKVGSVEGKSLVCRCGAPSCRGMLL
ncbi:similar to SET domain, bifurcated 1 [Ectocarpus siliculosus]|uniref:Similar to SET domain, bifurcated 1 n=1 Tax=Ectocarpus siliculosus TaxID=2880 RepID=D7FM06_ECTSI|nr:similar to SET domain, bifurcated 1 [Ectocarpus siliculosus]|eukprot:CBJ29831.1 similar to SET domain, bifurcated 1 [Ectocarpus siliculosus]